MGRVLDVPEQLSHRGDTRQGLPAAALPILVYR